VLADRRFGGKESEMGGVCASSIDSNFNPGFRSAYGTHDCPDPDGPRLAAPLDSLTNWASVGFDTQLRHVLSAIADMACPP
jgi:hypothetical protein